MDNSQSAVKATVTPITDANKVEAQAAATSAAASSATQKDQTSTSGLNVR